MGVFALNGPPGRAAEPPLRIQKGFKIDFLSASASAETYAFGETARLDLTFQNNSLGHPDAGYLLEICLTDRYGTEISCRAAPFGKSPQDWIPVEKWTETVHFSMPEQWKISPGGSMEGEPVFEGEAFFVFRLLHPEDRSRLILEDGRQPFKLTQTYLAASVWLAEDRPVMRAVAVPQHPHGQTVELLIENLSKRTSRGAVAANLRPKGGMPLWEETRAFTLSPKGKTSLRLGPDLPILSGEWVLETRLFEDGIETERRTKSIVFPSDFDVAIARGNKAAMEAGDNAAASLSIQIRNRGPARNSFRASADGEFTDWASVDAGGDGVLSLHPKKFVGTWSLLVERSNAAGGDRALHCATLPALTVGVADGKLTLNGEPFLVKGQNVGDLAPDSRSATAESLRLLKEGGYNLVRADHPAFWQIEAAREAGLFVMPLGPFSVQHTSALDARCANCGAAELARALAREYFLTYRDFDNVLLWNSANEIKGETDAVLNAFQRERDALDPLLRPVVYSNLGAQAVFDHQEVVGFNYYLSSESTPESARTFFQNYAGPAAAGGKAALFTEANAWRGPNETAGRRAMRFLWRTALDAGLSGGVFFRAWDYPERTPGAFDNPYYNNPRLGALRESRVLFRDVTLESERTPAGGAALRLRNRRPYAVRVKTVEIRSGDGPADRIEPDLTIEPNRDTFLPIPSGLSETFLLTADLLLESHGGFEYRESFVVSPIDIKRL